MMLPAALAAAVASLAVAPPDERTRLIVLTDISSITAGTAEPDDGQSLIRLMLYTNDLDVVAIVASSNLGHGERTRPDLIRRIVEAYGAVQPNLVTHDPRYPPARVLAARIAAGQPLAGLKLAVSDSVGATRDTEASARIIAAVDAPDPRPVWVTIWGGSADLAQALWRVRNGRTPQDLARFVGKLRVHSIHDQDSTGPWIREDFPGLFFVRSERTYRGMYRGGDRSLVSSAWVKANIHGHGALGDLYPDYNGGDIWSRTLGPVRGIKEGDTPSFLHLVPNGLGDLARLDLGSWGGRFEGQANRYADVADHDVDTAGDPDPRMSAVYRWRPAFQADFQARLDWCLMPYADANHPPVVRIDGDRRRTVAPGDEVTLDASHSSDPDGHALSFAWSIYPAMAGDAQQFRLDGQTTSVARFKVPPGLSGATIPVLLTVTDDGNPALARYGRIVVNVQ